MSRLWWTTSFRRESFKLDFCSAITRLTLSRAFGNDELFSLIRQVTSRRAHSAMGKPSKRTNLVKNESLPTQTCKAVIFGFDAPADPFVQYQLTERSTLPKSFA